VRSARLTREGGTQRREEIAVHALVVVAFPLSSALTRQTAGTAVCTVSITQPHVAHGAAARPRHCYPIVIYVAVAYRSIGTPNAVHSAIVPGKFRPAVQLGRTVRIALYVCLEMHATSQGSDTMPRFIVAA